MGKKILGTIVGLVGAVLMQAPYTSGAQERTLLTPGLGISNGAAGLVGQGKIFMVPNLGFELDLGWTPQVCGNCTLSQTTVTTNLFYWINPGGYASLYLVAGPGFGYFNLSQPVSTSSLLPVFDAGIGVVFWPSSRLGIELENRWFFPDGGLSESTGGSLTTNRWFIGLAVPI